MIALALLAAAQAAESPPPPMMPVQAVPSIDPFRLAAAQRAVAALVPEGIYLKMMRDQLPRMMDAMLAQMGGMRSGALGLPGDKTLAQTAEQRDPHFRERTQIMTRVMGEELGSVFAKMEPRVRAGLARSFARRFTRAQLDDMNAFFATPSGRAFASDYLLTFMDPELMQEMVALMPEMLKAMPDIMAKVEKATADLPPPPKPGDAK